MTASRIHPASYKDPDGFLFYHQDKLYRQINKSYKTHYTLLMQSGLYESLIKEKLLVPHEETDIPPFDPASCWKVIAPEPLQFISQPGTWSFSALKQAALLTLQIQIRALKVGLWLKDASIHNIQFKGSNPIFIDTLSFASHAPGAPWPAYRQYCEHFLAPLALMAHQDARLSSLLQLHPDGIPLDLACKLLPFRATLSPALFMHLFLHAWFQKASGRVLPEKHRSLPLHQLMGILENLVKSIEKLSLSGLKSLWSGYYSKNSYPDSAISHKKRVVETWFAQCDKDLVLDLGANTGLFSRVLASRAKLVISADSDPICTEICYHLSKKEGVTNLLPLTIDILNPAPATGFANSEHSSFTDSLKCSTIVALALLHHLRIRGNLPFSRFLEWAAKTSPYLIVEFVPREDPEASKMLLGRSDAFPDYSLEGFERALSASFCIAAREKLPDSGRILYLGKRIS